MTSYRFGDFSRHWLRWKGRGVTDCNVRIMTRINSEIVSGCKRIIEEEVLIKKANAKANRVGGLSEAEKPLKWQRFRSQELNV